MKEYKLFIFLFVAITLSILLIASAVASTLTFYKSNNAVARQLSCGDSCSLPCAPSDSNECCNLQGQYYSIWDTGEGGSTNDCRPATTCSAGEGYGRLIVNAHYVDWDAEQQYCTAGCVGASVYWNIGGEVAGTTCCGDDSGENIIAEQSSTDAPAGYNDGITGCCDAATDCNYNDVCTATGSVSASAIPDKAYCGGSNTWYGGDAGNTECTAIVGSGYWNIGGEVAATTCCGDDSGENKKTRACSSGCTSDSNDDACCDASTDCVYNSGCYATGSNICLGNLVLNCNAGTWQQSQDCDASDGWYNYGDTGPGCSQEDDPTAEQRDYSCSVGGCIYSVTQTKDCDASDGWYGGGDTAGCGDDASSQRRDYYTDSTGTCVYVTTNCASKDCDASDICSNTCDSTSIKTYKDYYVTPNTDQCAFTFGPLVEECTTKNSYESDSGCSDYLVSGYVYDYTGCSSGACSYSTYTDTCGAGDSLTEYCASGTSYSSATKGCNDYDISNCWCTAGSTLTETCDDWNCGSGKCQDSGSDRTNATWPSDGDCSQQSCKGVTYRDYHTNAGANTWGTSAEPTETACADGYDNNCNGQWDYDTLNRGGMGASPHGDSNCPVGITAIGLSASQKCPGETVTVECTSTVANVNSIDAYLDQNGDGGYSAGELCNFIDWQGSKARFSCTVGTSLGTKNVNCSVNTAKSYKSGTDKITQITVGGTSCCAGYSPSGSGTCETDSACDWCPECVGPKWSGDTDRCVAAGTCPRYCWKDKCGAGCDNTQGGCIGAQQCQDGTGNDDCTCDSGSCNPDTYPTKECCDYEQGFLPDKNVSMPITNFNKTCPPFETCYDSNWLFEVGNGNCCGDDLNEYWGNRTCSYWCTSSATDEACCNAATDCIYNSSCYSAASCYLTNSYCNAGVWENPDNQQSYCNSCFGNGFWDIGGDVSSCCGDDANEFKKVSTGGSDAPAGFATNSSDDACCNVSDKCSKDSTCYTSGSVLGAIPAKAYCNAGTWEGGDAGETQCTAVVATGRWALGGDVAQTTCCGDDSGEHYTSPANNRSCDGTSACCDSPYKYANNGRCVLSCEGGFAEGKWLGVGVGPYGTGERKLVFEISDTFNNPQSIMTDYDLPQNKLTHVVITFNNNNGEAKIYIDGTLKKSGIITRNIASLNQFPYSISPLAFPMKGSIDELNIYNRVLGKDEIKQKYQLGTQITYTLLPKKNEARTLKFNSIDNATMTEARVAPIVKVGAMNKICGVTSKAAPIQKCE